MTETTEEMLKRWAVERWIKARCRTIEIGGASAWERGKMPKRWRRTVSAHRKDWVRLQGSHLFWELAGHYRTMRGA